MIIFELNEIVWIILMLLVLIVRSCDFYVGVFIKFDDIRVR